MCTRPTNKQIELQHCHPESESHYVTVVREKGATYRNCKNMAINALVEQMCEEEGVGFVDLWGYCVGKEDIYI